MAITKELDLVGAVVAVVLGILLIIGTLSLDIVVGVAFLVVGILALARRL